MFEMPRPTSEHERLANLAGTWVGEEQLLPSPFDPVGGRCYTMHWFNSLGIEHDAPGLGSWEADTLTLVHETRHTGSSRYTYTVGDGVYRMRLEHSRDGKDWTTILEGWYTRIA